MIARLAYNQIPEVDKIKRSLTQVEMAGIETIVRNEIDESAHLMIDSSNGYELMYPESPIYYEGRQVDGFFLTKTGVLIMMISSKFGTYYCLT